MLIIKQGDIISISDAEKQYTYEYKALRQFVLEAAIQECSYEATLQDKKCDTVNRYDGETFIAEYLLNEGVLEIVKQPKHSITIIGNEYTFNK